MPAPVSGRPSARPGLRPGARPTLGAMAIHLDIAGEARLQWPHEGRGHGRALASAAGDPIRRRPDCQISNQVRQVQDLPCPSSPGVHGNPAECGQVVAAGLTSVARSIRDTFSWLTIAASLDRGALAQAPTTRGTCGDSLRSPNCTVHVSPTASAIRANSLISTGCRPDSRRAMTGCGVPTSSARARWVSP